MNATPTAPPARTPVHPTRKPRRAWLVLLATIIVGLVIDLGSKAAAFRYIADAPVVVDRAQVMRANHPSALIPAHEPVRIVPHVLEFTLVLNPGAVFGIGAGRRGVFMLFTGVAMVFAMMLFVRWTTARDTLSHAAVGLLVSGGLGNLYDRLVYACVRDFIHPLPGVVLPGGLEWPWGGREVWPYVSNIADLFLIIGIGALIWRTLRPIGDDRPAPAEPAGAADGPGSQTGSGSQAGAG
ncbi:MAG: signal peptidase II [Planctomycetota bacterium]|nr:signal peptidase II [Planctomycetota bacterium]